MRTFAVLLLLLMSTASAGARGLRAGVAKVDITPAGGEIMWGFEDRLTPASGTLDPLFARVLVLDDGRVRLTLIAVDLGRSFGPESLKEIRDKVRSAAGVSHVLLTATHTHSAPVVKDEYRSGPPPWEQEAIRKIAEAVRQAASTLQDARIGTGAGSVSVAHNRLRQNPDRTTTWFERNPERRPTTPVDPTVTVIRVDHHDGRPLAILVNYACHPVVLGSDSQDYSADFPAAMHPIIESQLSGQPMSFFLQGATGDINPYYAVTKRNEGAVKWRDWTGREIGAEVVRVARAIRTVSTPEDVISVSEDIMKFRLRWDPERFKAALLKFLGPQGLEIYGASVSPEIEAPATTVLINRSIALATMPGEPFVEFALEWRRRCPVPNAMLIGYANGYHGYFPTIDAASRRGYGAASASTWVEVGAGERILNRSLIKIHEMSGRYSDMPDDLKGNVYQ